MLIGVIFEMVGITIILPILSILSPNSTVLNSAFIKNYFGFILNLNHNDLVVYSMGFLVGIILIKSLYLIFISWFQANFSAKFSENLTKNLFERYIFQNYEFHLNNNSAFLLANVQNECAEMMHIIQALLTVILELFLLITVVIVLFYFEPLGAFFIGIILIISVLLFHQITKGKIKRWGILKQTFLNLKNKYILQGLGGIKEIKIFKREEALLKQFNQVILNNSNVVSKYSTITSLPKFYFEFLAILCLSSLIILLSFNGRPFTEIMPIIGVFLAAAFRIMPSVNRLISSYQMIKHSEPIINNIYAQNKLEFQVQSKEFHNSKFENKLTIENLSFRYKGAKQFALQNINFEIPKGSMIGIIGKSGSGKSTLIDIIVGLLNPTSGKIYCDNYMLDYTNSFPNINIGYIPQNIYLIDDTLRNNIAFGIEEEYIDDIKIVEALKKAEMYTYVSELPEYLNTNVGERGVKLSGGQRQRIGIARALYNNPEFIILDEATSALDTKTEEDVLRSIYRMKGEVTLIIIAHRLTTLNKCDFIYEIFDGNLINKHTNKI